MGKNTRDLDTASHELDSITEPLGHNQSYLSGLRGLLATQCFLWTFLSTFVPASVSESANNSERQYELVLRWTLSVLFWNQPLIYSSFILISARSVCIPFLQEPGATAIASSVFRRGIQLWFPCAVILAIMKILDATMGTAHIVGFNELTGNVSIKAPYMLPSTLSYFNGVFNIFWTTSKFQQQAGSTAFPSQTLWVVSLIYSQSYTVFMTMVICPYTRPAWRVKAYLCFIFTAWWVQSWAFYSITGLLLADIVINMDYQEKAKRGIKIWRTKRRCPIWIPCGISIAAGCLWQYFETDWNPKYQKSGLRTGGGLYYHGGIDVRENLAEPQPRTNNYLLLVGFFFLLECSGFLQRLFRTSLLVYLGRRSLSLFLVQSMIIYTVGIKLYMVLTLNHDLPVAGARLICLAVCVIAAVLGGEVFYRLVDCPSRALSHILYDWIRR